MKSIHTYEFEKPEPDWTEVRRLYPKNTSKYGGPYFLAGSGEEHQFLEYWRERGFALRRKTIVEYTGPDKTKAGLFLYLCLRNDDDGKCIPVDRPDFVDFTAACPGGDTFGVCDRGAKQVRPATIHREGLESVSRFDFIRAQYPFNPAIFLISRRLKDILDDADPTGCEIAPCQIVPDGNGVSESKECFQMKITGKPSGPVQVGSAQIWNRCPSCGAVKGFSSDSERYFCGKDLGIMDFQVCELYEASNCGRFATVAPFPIVSQRIFDILLANKIKGLFRYTTDPPVKYAVVQVI